MTKPQTRLINLPERIAKIERELLTMRTELKELYEKRDRLVLPIERQIAFDLNQECKNKEQRDVRRAELLLENEQYQETLRLIREQELKVGETEIKIRQLERQYSTEKLIARWVLGFQYSTISQMFDIDEVTANNGSERV
jgi:hypothetical protein